MGLRLMNENNGTENNGRPKAVAYLNLYLDRDNGSRKKLGFIVLNEGDEEDAQILEFFHKHGEKAAEAFANVITIECNVPGQNRGKLVLG